MLAECFTTLATKGYFKELKILLNSLSIFNPNSNIIIFVDQEIHKELENYIKENPLTLIIEPVIKLNKYTNKNRMIMEKEGIFKEFTIIKADLIEYALTKFKNTIFLDSDILVTNTIHIPDNFESFDIGLSPHFIQPKYTSKVGYFNAGLIFVKNRDFIEYWRYQTKKSRYFEQASLENCAKKFKTFLFGENYNVAWWKFDLGLKNKEIIYKLLTFDMENIYYNKNPIIFIHSHFNHDGRFNKEILKLIGACNKKRFLLDILKN
jgi:hypothetical protein